MKFKGWQQEQESNLEYVAVTREMEALIDVVAPSSYSEKE